MKLPEECRTFVIFVAVIFGAALIAGIMTPASIVTWLSLALAILLYFFLPGYMWMLLLDLEPIERVIFGFFAGAITVPVLLYFMNLFLNIRLTTITVLAAVLIATGIPFIIWVRRRKTTSLAQ
ncbi:MAG: hypothetical protein QXT19_01775 [Candidatus Woesearchaeota archaeon]